MQPPSFARLVAGACNLPCRCCGCDLLAGLNPLCVEARRQTRARSPAASMRGLHPRTPQRTHAPPLLNQAAAFVSCFCWGNAGGAAIYRALHDSIAAVCYSSCAEHGGAWAKGGAWKLESVRIRALDTQPHDSYLVQAAGQAAAQQNGGHAMQQPRRLSLAAPWASVASRALEGRDRLRVATFVTRAGDESRVSNVASPGATSSGVTSGYSLHALKAALSHLQRDLGGVRKGSGGFNIWVREAYSRSKHACPSAHKQ